MNVCGYIQEFMTYPTAHKRNILALCSPLDPPPIHSGQNPTICYQKELSAPSFTQITSHSRQDINQKVDKGDRVSWPASPLTKRRKQSLKNKETYPFLANTSQFAALHEIHSLLMQHVTYPLCPHSCLIFRVNKRSECLSVLLVYRGNLLEAVRWR